MPPESVYLRRPKRRLTDLVVDRVDLVDRGANPGAHITLAKRDHPAVGESPMPRTDNVIVKLYEALEDEAARAAGASGRGALRPRELAKAVFDFVKTPAGRNAHEAVELAVAEVRGERLAKIERLTDHRDRPDRADADALAYGKKRGAEFAKSHTA